MADVVPSAESPPETLEALQTRHRKEQRDLVSRTTQKKKQASKKTRKAVNDECERLEREVKERQAHELAVFHGEAGDEAVDHVESSEDEGNDDEQVVQAGVANLSVNGAAKPSSSNGDAADDAAAAGRQKKPNRAKARLARRAADQAAQVAAAEEEAANAPDPRELERERMAVQLQKHSLSLHEIRADGHCLYAAVADQLTTRELGLEPRIGVAIAAAGPGQAQAYKKVRHAAADWIQAHSDDFAGFMEDPLPEHVRKIRETGEWGGHLELLALARTYAVRIAVLHSDGRVDRIEAGDASGGTEDVEEIWLGYYKHSHGLGEHYNSLRKVG